MSVIQLDKVSHMAKPQISKGDWLIHSIYNEHPQGYGFIIQWCECESMLAIILSS